LAIGIDRVSKSAEKTRGPGTDPLGFRVV